MEQDKKYKVLMTRSQMEMVANALIEGRRQCPEPDCFMCCHYAEIERRLRHGLREIA